jgi:hypothetical protein
MYIEYYEKVWYIGYTCYGGQPAAAGLQKKKQKIRTYT